MIDLLQVNSRFKHVWRRSMLGLGAVLVGLAATGNLISAFPIAGIGNFIISAPTIQGVHFTQLFSISLLDVFPSTPATMIKLDSVSIEHGFYLTKGIDFTATPLHTWLSSVDISIYAPTVKGTKLAMLSSGLQARASHFDQFGAIESPTAFNIKKLALDPPKQIGLSAATLELDDAKLTTEALRSKTLLLGIIGAKIMLIPHPSSSNQESF